jgi:hypothetical protein
MGQTDPLQSETSSHASAALDATGDRARSQNVGKPGIERNSVLLLLILGLVVPLLGFFPTLVTVARELWLQPPFRFFPLAILVVIAFFVATCRPGPIDRTRGWVAFGLLVGGMLLGLWGLYLLSPTRVQLASVLVVLGWALGWYGGTRWTRIVAIWSILLVTVPWPFSLSDRTAQWLQTVAGSACNGFLEALYIPSVFESGVLRAEGVVLPVYEISRDAGGLLALMAFALAWVVYWRRPFVVAIAVIASVVVCVLMANVLRLLIILFVTQLSGFDLSRDWPGILMGVMTFLVSALFIICADYAAKAWFAPLELGETPNRTMRAFQRWVAWPPADAPSVSEQVASSRTWAYLGLPAALCLLLGLLSFYGLFIKGQPVSPLDATIQQVAERLPGESVFPEQFANLKRTKFEQEIRPIASMVGKYTQSWQLEGGEASVHISMDFPMAMISSPDRFYELAGWTIEKSSKTEMAGAEPFLVQQVTIANRFGVSATAWHAYFDESGKPATASALGANARSDLLSVIRPSGEAVHRYFQVRMFVETGRELSAEQQEPYQQLFLQVFDRLRQSTLNTVNASR